MDAFLIGILSFGMLIASAGFLLRAVSRSPSFDYRVLPALELAVGDEIRIGRQWRAIRALMGRDNGVLLFLDNLASGDFYHGNIRFNVRRTK